MFIIPAPTTQPDDGLPAAWASRQVDEEEAQRDVVAAPRTVLRLMASISLGLDVVGAGIQGSVLEREERSFYRCLLKAEGIVVGSRWNASPTTVPLPTCYAHDIRFVRICTGAGTVALVCHVIAVLLLLIALAIGRRRLSFPWVGWSLLVALQEVILIGACWSLLFSAELALFGCHALMLATSVVLAMPFLQDSVVWVPVSPA
ncbi:uncharacterized protein LOC134763772 [Penaeus indicus]|uniref:uncharacterized protein LOC134763772 n=1 Tax=Penaeus indicus TaxID=29960 RepID=UPI00300C9690